MYNKQLNLLLLALTVKWYQNIILWQDSQVPGHKIKYSLYFYTYNKTLSWEVKYLSSFQSYYSSAICIQFFGYFNSSNSWTVYTI